ncbi:hypothetical protein, partial [Enterobacter hormaechei]|uniref:hypothetical protein n=1 Tax=Enterobacter hormaechei TaxID=158836 RepID=UPI00203FA6AA
ADCTVQCTTDGAHGVVERAAHRTAHVANRAVESAADRTDSTVQCATHGTHGVVERAAHGAAHAAYRAVERTTDCAA